MSKEGPNSIPVSTAVELGYTQVRNRRGKGGSKRRQPPGEGTPGSPQAPDQQVGPSSQSTISSASGHVDSQEGSPISLHRRVAQVQVQSSSQRYSATPLLSTIPDSEDPNGSASAPGFQSLPAAFYSAVAQAAAAAMYADHTSWEGAIPHQVDSLQPDSTTQPMHVTQYITPDRPSAPQPVNRCVTMPVQPMTLSSMTHYRSSVPEHLNHPQIAEQFLRDVNPWDAARGSADLTVQGLYSASQQLPPSPSRVITAPRRSSSPGRAQAMYSSNGNISPTLLNRPWFNLGNIQVPSGSSPRDYHNQEGHSHDSGGPTGATPFKDPKSSASSYRPSDHAAHHNHNLSTDSTTAAKEHSNLQSQPSQLSNQASPRYQLSSQNIASLLSSGKSGQLLLPSLGASAGGDRPGGGGGGTGPPAAGPPHLGTSVSITAGAAAATSGSELQPFWEYLKGEASPPPKLPTADVVWGQTERDRVQFPVVRALPAGTAHPVRDPAVLGFITVCGHTHATESCHGAVPAAVGVAAGPGPGLVAGGPVKAGGHKLAGNQVYDIICLFIVMTTTATLRAIKPGFIYYWLKDITSEFLKMSVLSSAFEITDKILSNVGMDVMEALSGTCTLWVGGRRSHAQLAADTCVALMVTLTHAITLMCQGLVLAVALNSRRQGLLALLIANNFVEIKGTVLKRWDVPRIWGLVCQDIVERLHLWGVLCFVVVEDMDSSASWRPSMLILWESARILGSEVVIDVLKHAVLGKFNDMRPGIYREYTKDLCEKAVVSQSHMLNKLMGFQNLPTACLILRSVTTLFWLKLDTPSITQLIQRGGMAFLAWVCLLVVKPLLGYALKIQAHSYLTYYNLNFPKPPTRTLPSQLIRAPLAPPAAGSTAHAAHANTTVTLGGAVLASGAQQAGGETGLPGKSGGTGVSNSAAGSATVTPRAVQGVQGPPSALVVTAGSKVGVQAAAVGPGSSGNLGLPGSRVKGVVQTTGGAVPSGSEHHPYKQLPPGAAMRHGTQSARGGVGDGTGQAGSRVGMSVPGGVPPQSSQQQSGLKKRKSKGGSKGGLKHA